ncbi:class I SAM-dependent methyltransferase [Streptomyces goshikiensis]|uniref:class I SAM-dependent methyltransferase n=1 Tax=Streptomyces goshikiensis TaxID=1942 RepID=UPI00371F2714
MVQRKTARQAWARMARRVRLHTVEDWQRFNLSQPGRDVSPAELDMFRQRVPLQEKMRALDIGCGNGRWTRELAKLGLEVTGFDWDWAAVERADTFPTLYRGPTARCGDDPSRFTGGGGV